MTKMSTPAFEVAAGLKPLLPSQTAVLEKLEDGLASSSSVALSGGAGAGKTRIARELARRIGAHYMDMTDYFATLHEEPKERWDERAYDAIEKRLRTADALVLDDFMYLRTTESAPRSRIYAIERMARLRDIAEEGSKKLILVGRSRQPAEERTPDFFDNERDTMNFFFDKDRSPITQIGSSLEPEDYKAMLVGEIGADRARGIDEEIIYFHAPQLSLRQLALACNLLEAAERPTTDDFVEVVNAFLHEDNTRLGDVEALSFDLLPGTEDIARTLEAHVVMPFENPELARRLGVKARRGVMLFGLPGTGKTAIGRALAHRMKGKFFMIDGSISTEPAHGFMMRVKAIIDQAVKHAPSVLFVDDADNLFFISHVAGLTRYLLSLLDGMESENAGKVCVMMTVMDAAKVPDALTRSGRVELWLETKPPSEDVRAQIFRRWTGRGLPGVGDLDYRRLAALSEGLLPADIRRIMGDARLLCARDRQAGSSLSDAQSYVERAIGDLRNMRGRMAQILEGEKV